MFKTINQIISLDNFYDISKEVDIIKGINKRPLTLKQFYLLGVRNATKKIINNNGNK